MRRFVWRGWGGIWAEGTASVGVEAVISCWVEAATAKRSFARPRDVGPARPERSTLLSNRRAPRLKKRFNYFGDSRI